MDGQKATSSDTAMHAVYTDLGRPYTGWPPGLLQDDSRALFDWFASRLDARQRVRDVCGEQRTLPHMRRATRKT